MKICQIPSGTFFLCLDDLSICTLKNGQTGFTTLRDLLRTWGETPNIEINKFTIDGVSQGYTILEDISKENIQEKYPEYFL